MRLSELAPAFTDRALFVGQTGSGKTTLAQYLLEYRRNVVVIDPKRRIDWPGYKVVQSVKALTKARESRLVFRPSFIALKNWRRGDDEVERFFEWVYRRTKTTLYVDEIYLVTDGEELPMYYHACLTQGRELKIETWSATQRPMNVPQVTMSEAEHLYAFRLRMPQDRKKVEAVTGMPDDFMAEVPKHYFYYARQDADPIGPLRLNLDSLRSNDIRSSVATNMNR